MNVWLNYLKKLSWHFLSLFFLLVLIDSRNWVNSVIPIRDGFPVAQTFYIFYNEFFYHHHLVRWLPYGSFGISADFIQMMCLTPMSYLAAVVGVIFRIQNAFLLFKLSVFLEQLLLLCGTYLLSGEIFRRKTVVFFVCVGVMGSTIWLMQLFWNFRIYYFLPWMFYFLVLFFNRSRPHYLWLVGIFSVISMIGNLPYFIVLHFLLLAVFAGILLISNRLVLRCLYEKSFKNIIYFLLFLGVTGVVFYVIAHMFDEIKTLRPGRDPITHLVTANEFLTAGFHVGLKKFFGFFCVQADEYSHHTLYVGLIPIVFFLYALIHVRTAVFTAFSTITLFLICFTLGDICLLARNLFESFPPLQLFHYIGVVGGLLRFFIMIVAGFGLQHLLDACSKASFLENKKMNMNRLFFCVIMVVLSFCLITLVNQDGRGYVKKWILFGCFSSVWLIFAFFLIRKLKTFAKWIGIIVVIFFVVEILAYQGLFLRFWHFKYPWVESSMVNIHPYNYQPTRKMDLPRDYRSKSILRLAYSGTNLLALEMFGHLQLDFCFPQIYMTSYWKKGVWKFNEWRGSSYKEDPNLFFWRAVYFQTAGCSDDKLKLVSDVAYAQNDRVAERVFRSSFKPVVIEAPVPEGASRGPQVDGKVRVNEFNFNSIEMEADVFSPGGAWLYYADAYHPLWKATVDGKETPIYRANIGFKAVYLNTGQHKVKMSYGAGLQGIMAYMLVLIGLIFAIGLFGWFFRFVMPSRYLLRFCHEKEGN